VGVEHRYIKFLTKLRRGYIWKRIFLERLTEPLHLNIMALFVALFGTFRAKVAFDLVLRHHHAYGLLSAADEARELGIARLTVLEFGVSTGAGLLNMADVAAKVTRATGIQFEIYGFDTGQGMPLPRSARDHPELYQAGDFAMNVAELKAQLPGNVTIVLGELEQTVPEFRKTLSTSAPVGFVSLDVDYYFSSKDALQIFSGPAECYLPRTCLYADDIEDVSHNSFCGEQLAMAEFSRDHEFRKIERYPFLSRMRVFQRAPWILHIYTVHVLDHPSRTTLQPRRAPMNLLNPYLSRSGEN
jgi:hypothetical protein